MFGWGRNEDLRGFANRTIVVVSLAATLAGCTVAANTGGASPSLPPRPPTANASTTAPQPLTSTAPTATPTLAATPTPVPVASIPPRPEGEWTALRWPNDASTITADSASAIQFRMFGTATGYLGFRTTPSTAVLDASLVAETSPDGLHWTPGQSLELPTSDGATYGLQVGQLIVGPASMIAAGYAGATCGPSSVSGMWRSTDGRAWQLIDMAKAFGADSFLRSVDGGSAGFIATGFTNQGKTNRIWTSVDGSTWRSSALPTAAGKVVADGGTAFSGGFVLAGTVVGGEGCGAGPVVTPSLWSSSDGKVWSRDALPNAPSGSEATTMICRIDDSDVLAVAYTYNERTPEDRQLAWFSRDGRTWHQADVPGGCNVLSDGRRGILVSADANATHFSILAKDGKLHELRPSGNPPTELFASGLWTAALGPTGLVVSDSAGTTFLLAVPLAA